MCGELRGADEATRPVHGPSCATCVVHPPVILNPTMPPRPTRRLETVDAAVERETLAQARAFAEAALVGERTARLAAEQELALLAAAAEVRRGCRSIPVDECLQLNSAVCCSLQTQCCRHLAAGGAAAVGGALCRGAGAAAGSSLSSAGAGAQGGWAAGGAGGGAQPAGGG